MKRTLAKCLVAFLFAQVTMLIASGGQDTISFNHDIRPILADNCFYCHGPDPGTRKASLRLDREEGFFGKREDGPTVIKGKPDDSPLYQRLVSEDKDEMMPPLKEHKQLKPAQIAAVRRWIEQGAVWQPHWSFLKPVKAEVPENADRAQSGITSPVRNPIDAFVFQKLAQNGLSPAPEADRRVLARRLSFDLIGLPPEPALVEQFVADPAPDAYEKLVDMLLSSPRYGEHRARYWLDAARYADTHGLHYDNYREIWPYRDWVINAFNRNEPFDQFTVEQIAGDLLPNPTRDQLIATGFHRCNITTNEGGTIPEENLANYAKDRVETTSWVWLGLTANCAACHDHKFDPITTKDYYAMSAFFRNTVQKDKDLNVRDTAPVLVLPEGKDAERWEAISKETEATNAATEARRMALVPEFEQWSAKASVEDLDTLFPGLTFSLPLNRAGGCEVTGLVADELRCFELPSALEWRTDGKREPAPVITNDTTLNLGDLADFERSQPFSFGVWVKVPRDFTRAGSILARMDSADSFRGWDLHVNGGEFAVHLIHRWPEDALKVSTTGGAAKRDEWRHVLVTYDGSGTAAGVRIFVNGSENKLRTERDALKGTMRTATSLRVGQRSSGEYFNGAVQDIRFYTRQLYPTEAKALARLPEVRPLMAKPAEQRSPAEKSRILDLYAARDPEIGAASLKLAAFEVEKKVIGDRNLVTLIQQERMDMTPKANLLYRGQYDQPREELEPAVFASLHPLPQDAPLNRLGLARWLVSPENPLTARVTVNRFWQEIFGTGLVKTAEDFGIMSEAPSHPELLDWLAVEFRESGWDVKHLIRLLVTSSTYRQSAIATREKLERDPHNRLLSRGPRFRLDAEEIRDTALAASGLLSPKIGGPSAKPYQPEGVWEAVAMPESNTRNYKADTGENLYRRSVYTFWKRSAPPASMEVFNAPSRETSCVRRERTDTPLQALVTLNDPQFVEAARVLAESALKARSGSDDNAALNFIAKRLLARPLRDRELEILKASQRDLLSHYEANASDAQALLAVGERKSDVAFAPAQLAAWTMVCNQMMNLDEVLNK